MTSGSINFLIVDPLDVQLAVENEDAMESTIKLRNASEDEMIFFKVRLTDPDKYCVQPTKRVIWPKCSTILSVTCTTPPNPPEVGRSDDLFNIQNFRLKLTDVASRKIKIDPSTAFFEFQKHNLKPKVNQLKLNISFVADRPIDDNATNLFHSDFQAELEATKEGRLKLTEELAQVKAEVVTTAVTTAEERGKLEIELVAAGAELRDRRQDLVALETTEEGRIKLTEELRELRAIIESMSLHLNLMQTDVIICNEDKDRFKKERDNQKILFWTITILLVIMVAWLLT